MSLNVATLLVLMVAYLGTSRALECVSCSWEAKNNTIDDKCLGDPHETDSVTCQEDNPSQRYMCQTEAKFETKNGEMNILSISRKCGINHQHCNNACEKGETTCWLCCNDNSHCNGFPVRVNLAITSSSAKLANRQPLWFSQLILFISVWLFVSFQ